MFLMHGAKEASLILSHLRPGNFVFELSITTVQAVEEEIGNIQFNTLFRDHTVDTALIEETNQKKKWDELHSKFISLSHSLGHRLQVALEPYIPDCQTQWMKGHTTAIKSLEEPLIKFSKTLRLEQLEIWKKVISQNSHKLSPSVGFMYYAIIKTHKQASETTLCHAFALQQVQVDTHDMYAVLQSWNDSYAAFDVDEDGNPNQSCRLFFKKDLDCFFEDLERIFESDRWDDRTNCLWMKWFGRVFFRDQSKPICKVKLETKNTSTSILDVRGLSLSFSFAEYNPITINRDIEKHSEMIQHSVKNEEEFEI